MNDKKNELNGEEQEFLHKMFEENFDFDEWADSMDKAIENGEIDTEPTKDEIEIEFDLDDFI